MRVLAQEYLRSLNMNEYMKNIWFLRTSLQDMVLLVLRDIINQYLWLIFFSRFNMIFPRYIYIQHSSCELTEDFLLIMLLPIFNSSIFKGNVSLVGFLWNKVWLVLVTFNDNLFALNHSHIFSNSQLTVTERAFIFWLE